jgi:SAM-dependent methyltransferase
MPSNPGSIKQKIFPTNHRILLERRLARHLLHCIGNTLVIGAGHDPYRSKLQNASKIVTNDIDSKLDNIDIVSPAENIPQNNSTFDSVVAIEVFEHVRDMKQCIKECARLLKPGGVLYFTMPFMFHIHADPSDFRRLTKDGIKAYLDNNFEISEISYYGNAFNVICDILSSCHILMRIFRPFFYIATLIPFSSDKFPSGVTVLARKK